ncbi:hypothetical protein HRI_000596800 [Hibiscus trionum]|uniref:Integrase catalytic domain-containing protein n=1 Tax=Hibiscus trionum TaxID=183268 RepID=A0A9W7LN31_HIBTR|nr:hypothetical protein HRI_000596800 [Hibiscus trionum]
MVSEVSDSSKPFTNKSISIRLDDTNYLLWRQQIQFAIESLALQDHLDESFSVPEQFVTGEGGRRSISPEYARFKQEDSALCSWLLSSIGPSILPSLVNCKNALQIWTKIHQVFSVTSTTRIMHLHCSLKNIWKRDQSMREYLAQIQGVCDSLAACGNPLTETMHISAILTGLPPEYEPVVAVITSSQQPYKLDGVASVLLDTESRQLEFLSHGSLVNYAYGPTGSSNVYQVNQQGGPFNGPNNPNAGYPNSFAHSTPQRPAAPVFRPPNSNRGGMPFRGRGGRFFNGGRSRPQCQICGKIGHLASRCYFRFDQAFEGIGGSANQVSYLEDSGEDQSFQGSFGQAPVTAYQGNSFQSQGVQGSNQTDLSGSVPPSSAEPVVASVAAVSDDFAFGDAAWYPDSGATSHLTPDAGNIYFPLSYAGSGKVSVADGSTVAISSIGNSSINSSVRPLVLTNLLHVPSIKKNLLSVSKFTRDNSVSIEFFPDSCVVKDLTTRQQMLRGFQSEGLYKLVSDESVVRGNSSASSGSFVVTSSDCNTSADAFACNSSVGFHVWHRRLGHPSIDTLAKLSKICKFSVINTEEFFCEACKLGKSHKLPFQKSVSVYNKPLEHVQMDVWGPAPLLSNNYAYYVSFFDAATRYTWIYFVARKSDVPNVVVNFHSMVERQTGSQLKVVQSDCGSEFKPLGQYFLQKGVQFLNTCPYSSEQNGRVERKHRHIVELGLTLLAQSGVPFKYWSDAFYTSVYLINRLPTRVLGGSSPYEIFFGKVPDYGFLKVFGCQCFPLTRPFNQHKLQPRSKPCLFLGYCPNRHGYKCLDSEGKLIVSRHVQFNENFFPCLQKKQSHSKSHSSSSDSKPVKVKFVSPRNVSSSQDCSPSSSNLQTSSSSSEFHSFSTDPSVSSSGPCDFVSSDSPVSSIPSPHVVVDDTSVEAGSQDIAQSVPQSSSQNSLSSSQLLQHSSNPTHTMVIRSKAGVFKPKAFLSEVEIPVPTDVYQALSVGEWKDAVMKEFNALVSKDTWKVVPLPPDRVPIGCKWLFKVKKNADGSISRYKARLVAKGFSQQAGFDYSETFSPVDKPVTVRILLSVALNNGWALRQIDVDNAFLNGDISEEVYMQQPPGFEQKNDNGQQLVCKLQKSLYGLKQAPRAWFDKFKGLLISQLKFTSSLADSSLYFRESKGSIVYIMVYVDDIVVTGNSSEEIDSVVQQINSAFSLKDLGKLTFFLGMNVVPVEQGIVLNQKKHILELLEKTKMLEAVSTPTPMVTSPPLSLNDGDPFEDCTLYRQVVGTLQHICTTRPDIQFFVNKVSQYMQAPRDKYWKAVKRIVRYLKGTIEHGLFFSNNSLTNDLVGYTDSDWGTNVDDKRSTGGHCLFFGGNLVSWCSKKQSVVSRSSTEAEFRSLADSICDAMWVKSLLAELKIQLSKTPVIWCDNTSAIAHSANPVHHAKLKHVELDLSFVREKVAEGSFQVNYVPALEQIADVFTKPLSAAFFLHLRQKLRVFSPTELQTRVNNFFCSEELC